MAKRKHSFHAADAEKARAAAQAATDPSEALMTLPEQLADSAEKKAEAGDLRGAAKADDAILALTRVLSAVEKRLSVPIAPAGAKAAEKPTGRVQCASCRQYTTVCGGEHKVLRCLPSMDMIQHFGGVIWNGVEYVGECIVPARAADAIKAQIGRWEANERSLFIAKPTRELAYGTVSPGMAAAAGITSGSMV